MKVSSDKSYVFVCFSLHYLHWQRSSLKHGLFSFVVFEYTYEALPQAFFLRRKVTNHRKCLDPETWFSSHVFRVETRKRVSKQLDESSFFSPPEYLKDLGSGQYGLVFQGKVNEDIKGETSRVVAVKTLREGSSPDAIKEFCQEVNIMSTFSHPNVVKLVRI